MCVLATKHTKLVLLCFYETKTKFVSGLKTKKSKYVKVNKERKISLNNFLIIKKVGCKSSLDFTINVFLLCYFQKLFISGFGLTCYNTTLYLSHYLWPNRPYLYIYYVSYITHRYL